MEETQDGGSTQESPISTTTNQEWLEFCEIVKHKHRYFFHHKNVSGSKPLSAVGVIESLANELSEHTTVLKEGRVMYRARRDPAQFESDDYLRELSPPPPELARANRMSASGISMSYLANTEGVALRETADRPGAYGIAKFRSTRDLVVIDLVDLEWATQGDRNGILSTIVDQMTAPIARDDRVHIDYIPTQVFTDLFYSQLWLDSSNRRIAGIRFPSARDAGGVNYVLFFNQEQFLASPRPFVLDDYREVRITGIDPFKRELDN